MTLIPCFDAEGRIVAYMPGTPQLLLDFASYVLSVAGRGGELPETIPRLPPPELVREAERLLGEVE